jgi:hypothetical protein
VLGVKGSCGRGAVLRGNAESSSVEKACPIVGGSGNGLSKTGAGATDCRRDIEIVVSVSFVASAHESGEGGAVVKTAPGAQASASAAASLIDEKSAPKQRDLVGREKFSIDLDSLILELVAVAASSFGGGSGRGGVVGRSGDSKTGCEEWEASSGSLNLGDAGRLLTAMPLISVAGC